MAIAPEPYCAACLEVMRMAILQARSRADMGYPHKQIAALMDAIHNIPNEIANWGPRSETSVREWLRCFDERWKDEVLSLEGVFDNALGKS